jgi:nucleosome binding factor SPN SPT16 subunit
MSFASTRHSTFYRNLQDQEAQYNLLLALQADLLSFIKEGLTAKDVYQHAVNYVKTNMPDVEKYFVKNIGFAVSRAFELDRQVC